MMPFGSLERGGVPQAVACRGGFTSARKQASGIFSFSNMPKELDLQRLNECIERGRSSLGGGDSDSATDALQRRESDSWYLCIEAS